MIVLGKSVGVRFGVRNDTGVSMAVLQVDVCMLAMPRSTQVSQPKENEKINPSGIARDGQDLPARGDIRGL